jgi:hypothetical protein
VWEYVFLLIDQFVAQYRLFVCAILRNEGCLSASVLRQGVSGCFCVLSKMARYTAQHVVCRARLWVRNKGGPRARCCAMRLCFVCCVTLLGLGLAFFFARLILLQNQIWAVLGRFYVLSKIARYAARRGVLLRKGSARNKGGPPARYRAMSGCYAVTQWFACIGALYTSVKQLPAGVVVAVREH